MVMAMAKNNFNDNLNNNANTRSKTFEPVQKTFATLSLCHFAP